MHTLVKIVNGKRIFHWSLGNVFYIDDNGEWIHENKSLEYVEKMAQK